ncbi:MAG: pyridoxamine 5'-phosphate oxidase family protein [Alphaproteobacteria bacterium]|nr:pyridoxamine 5'-phosphate oxidase family protein [Alphaproteobacteria bacterium]MBU1515444.1 pyridoxamine 5'-phosphate oxidase family protein [Alphaproteobacteria bacterium]MBU2095442.1 pyridoxamine 5'-phosphate oxidase family protein [Alphaproteobacteria bacterium]MBU2150684.1 pyridoxamine 5'-phosphate oxidase family protein [Alphaproteobacteria bacterium]MBU2306948.1 pyridoxamine 5'-phosphate oxidase family protein [Alphaproteobacteria bacterium]
MYHEGNRALQDAFGSRALADRLDEKLRHDRFTDGDAAFIAGQCFFFLATADAEGRPDCSFKGGPAGFAQVVAPDLLVFPDYDGNGMFKSLGNIAANPHVGLLFIAMGERAGRLRVNGRAEVTADDPAMADIPGAQLLVKITPVDIFPNCPRYIPRMAIEAASPYAPIADAPPVEPKWKAFPDFAEVVPPRRR